MPCACLLHGRCVHDHYCCCPGNFFQRVRGPRGLSSCVLRLPFSSQYRRSVAGCESGMNLLIAGHDGNPFRLSLSLHAIVSRALPMPCAYLLRGRCVHDHCPGPGNSPQRVRGPRGLSSCVLQLPFSSQCQRSVAGCESGMNLLIGSFWTENYAMVKKNFQTLKTLLTENCAILKDFQTLQNHSGLRNVCCKNLLIESAQFLSYLRSKRAGLPFGQVWSWRDGQSEPNCWSRLIRSSSG